VMDLTDAGLAATTPLILGGAATSFASLNTGATTASGSDYIPPIASMADLVVGTRSNSVFLQTSGGAGLRFIGVAGNSLAVSVPAFPVAGDGTIQYKVDAFTGHVVCTGYYVKEVG